MAGKFVFLPSVLAGRANGFNCGLFDSLGVSDLLANSGLFLCSQRLVSVELVHVAWFVVLLPIGLEKPNQAKTLPGVLGQKFFILSICSLDVITESKGKCAEILTLQYSSCQSRS